MISTRFGTPVKVIGAKQEQSGQVWLKVIFLDGRPTENWREHPLYEFRADGGYIEIVDAIRALPEHVRLDVDL